MKIAKSKFTDTGLTINGKSISEAQHDTGVIRVVGDVPAEVELTERVISGNKVMVAIGVKTINAFDFGLLKDAALVSTVGAENVSALLAIASARKQQYAK